MIVLTMDEVTALINKLYKAKIDFLFRYLPVTDTNLFYFEQATLAHARRLCPQLFPDTKAKYKYGSTVYLKISGAPEKQEKDDLPKQVKKPKGRVQPASKPTRKTKSKN